MVKIIGRNEGVQELKSVLIKKGIISDAELKTEKELIKQKDKNKKQK
jgi:hypothetical protein